MPLCIKELSLDIFVWEIYRFMNFPEQRVCFYDGFLSHASIHAGWVCGGRVAWCVFIFGILMRTSLLENACMRRLIDLYWFAGLVIDEKPDLKFVQSWVRANCKCSALSGSHSILCKVFYLPNSEGIGMFFVGWLL